MSLLPENDPSQNTFKFEDLVGDGKRYKDPDAVAKAVAEKDRFIEQLKAENAQVRQELQARPAVDRSQEILDQLEALAKPTTRLEDTTPQERVEHSDGKPSYKGLTEEDVFNLLAQREAKARAEANMNKVRTELVEKFGDKYDSVLRNLQDKLGVNQKFLDDLAAQSPAAFSKLLDDNKEGKPVFTPPATSRPDAFKPTGGGPKPRSEYLRMKAENKALYDSPAIQKQMYEDSMKLGEAFFDTNE